MKRLILFLALFYPCLLWSSVEKVEYFFDVDPGYGNGFDGGAVQTLENTPTKMWQSLTLNASIEHLDDGFHTFFVRVKNNHGWSHTLSRQFVKMTLSGDIANKVEHIEYFFDSEPGFGSGNALDLIPTSSDEYIYRIDLDNLSDGMHTLHIRAKNKNGWSNIASHAFSVITLSDEIDSIEYFFDTDPGIGQASALEVTPTNDGRYILDIDLNDLTDGFHTFFVRARNEHGWSHTLSRAFMMMTLPGNEANTIDYIECFFDTDPGYGSGKALDINSSGNDQYVYDIDMSELSDGFHTFYIRAKSKNGWSHLASRLVYKTVLPDEYEAEIGYAEYYFDTDPGKGKGTAFTFAPSQSTVSFTADISSLTDGEHVIHIRGEYRLGNWAKIGEHSFTVVSGDFIDSIENEAIKAYPNPVINELFIQNNNRMITQVEVHSLNGQVLHKQAVSEQTIQLPFSTYKPGVYLVRISMGNEVKTIKVIKQ